MKRDEKFFEKVHNMAVGACVSVALSYVDDIKKKIEANASYGIFSRDIKYREIVKCEDEAADAERILLEWRRYFRKLGFTVHNKYYHELEISWKNIKCSKD